MTVMSLQMPPSWRTPAVALSVVASAWIVADSLIWERLPSWAAAVSGLAAIGIVFTVLLTWPDRTDGRGRR